MGEFEDTPRRSGTEYFSQQHALQLDAEDPLKHLRAEFIIPSRADLKRKTLIEPGKFSHAKLVSPILRAYWQHRIVERGLNHPLSHTVTLILASTSAATP